MTYNPITHDTYWAEKGKGAFLGNEKRLRVAARTRMDEALLGTGVPFIGKPGHGQFLKELHQITQRVSGVRRLAPRPWTWPGSPPAGWTPSGNAACSPGTWRPECC